MPADEAEAAGRRDYLSAWLAIGEMSRQGSSWSGRERNTFFLNSADGRFADASAVSGFDFPDDGRAAALTDWDGDGDLDLWVASRTGPRVRFLRNRTSHGDDFVAFRLQGTRTNRDAIGARVRLHIDSDARPRIQGLRAGEGFLAQSSKWVHFGLAGAGAIEAVEVVWPGGEIEHFSGAQLGGRYLLVEGSGLVRSLGARPPLELEAGSAEASQPSGASRVRLTARPVMPPIDYETFGSEPRRLTVGSGAILLNLWASWCAPCVAELRGFEAHRAELDAAGLSVVALSVDEDLDRARALIQDLQLTFEVGVAPTDTLDVLDILQKALMEERRRLALPTSFLIDADGRLAVLYRGAVSVDELERDLTILPLEGLEARAATVPLPGRWATRTTPFPHGKLAGEYASFGHPALAELYRRIAGRRSIEATPGDALASDLAKAFDRLARGDRQEAEAMLGELVERLAQRLTVAPEDTTARNRLGIVLIALNRPGTALGVFDQVLERDPSNVVALSNATVLSWQGGRSERAEALLERLAELDPEAASEIRYLMAADRP